MSNRPEVKSVDSEPMQSSEERPIVAAAIVFSPIICAILLLICYVLLHK